MFPGKETSTRRIQTVGEISEHSIFLSVITNTADQLKWSSLFSWLPAYREGLTNTVHHFGRHQRSRSCVPIGVPSCEMHDQRRASCLRMLHSEGPSPAAIVRLGLTLTYAPQVCLAVDRYLPGAFLTNRHRYFSINAPVGMARFSLRILPLFPVTCGILRYNLRHDNCHCVIS